MSQYLRIFIFIIWLCGKESFMLGHAVPLRWWRHDCIIDSPFTGQVFDIYKSCFEWLTNKQTNVNIQQIKLYLNAPSRNYFKWNNYFCKILFESPRNKTKIVILVFKFLWQILWQAVCWLMDIFTDGRTDRKEKVMVLISWLKISIPFKLLLYAMKYLLADICTCIVLQCNFLCNYRRHFIG